MRALLITGTRAGALALAPLARALEAEPGVELRLLEHGREPLATREIFARFGVASDLTSSPTPTSRAARAAAALEAVGRTLDEVAPDVVIVEGDSTTAFAGALAASYTRIPVAHVGAGLRAPRRAAAPHESHGRMIAAVSDLLFAPTETSRRRLLAERIADARVHVTGHPIVDALARARAEGWLARPPRPEGTRHLVVLALAGRESLDESTCSLLEAVRRVARAHGDVALACAIDPFAPVHAVEALIGATPGVQVLPALDTWGTLGLLASADVILTDDTGVQEVAPALDVPLLIVGDETDRMELVDAGGAFLLGGDPARIERETSRLLRNRALRGRMARARNPFGDGRAASRIARTLVETLGHLRGDENRDEARHADAGLRAA